MVRKGFIAVAALAALVACKGSGPAPKEAATTWLKSMDACDVAGIKAGMTKSSVTQLDQLNAQLAAFVPPDQAKGFDLYKELCKSFKAKGIVAERDEVDGDNATVYLKADGKEQKAPMRREDGAWKLDLSSMMKAPPGGGGTAGTAGTKNAEAPAGVMPGTTQMTKQAPGGVLPGTDSTAPSQGPSPAAVPSEGSAPSQVQAPGQAPKVDPGQPQAAPQQPMPKVTHPTDHPPVLPHDAPPPAEPPKPAAP